MPQLKYFLPYLYLYLKILTIFLPFFVLAVIYAYSLPSTYRSKLILQVGSIYLGNETYTLIQPLREIKYSFDGDATINPIPNSRLIEIIASDQNEAISEERVLKTAKLIIDYHEKSIKNELKSGSSNLTRSEIPHATQIVKKVETIPVSFNPILKKIIISGFCITLLIAIFTIFYRFYANKI